MWVLAAVCRLVATNVGPVADIVGPGHRIVAVNVVPKRALFAGPAIYDCGPLHLVNDMSVFRWYVEILVIPVLIFR